MIHRFPLFRALSLFMLCLPALATAATSSPMPAVAPAQSAPTSSPLSKPASHPASHPAPATEPATKPGIEPGPTPLTLVPLTVGQTAPDFTLPALSGEVYQLRDMLNQGDVLLIFWSTRCAFCHAMLPEFKAADRRYGSRGLTLAAIDIGDEKDSEVRQYVQDYGVPYLVLNDDKAKPALIRDYHLLGTPTIILIGSDGKVLYNGHRLPDLSQWFPDEATAGSAADPAANDTQQGDTPPATAPNQSQAQ